MANEIQIEVVETSKIALLMGLTQQGIMYPFAFLSSFIFSLELGPNGWGSSGYLKTTR